MKVLLVHYSSAEPGVAGGAESALRDQRKALELLGHEVTPCFEHPANVSIGYDLIHFHTVHIQLGLGVLEWAQKKGVPHCLSLHDYWPFCFDGRMLLAAGDQSCAAVSGVCDGVCQHHPSNSHVRDLINRSPTVTFNPYSAEIFERNGIHISKVIPHGIDTGFFRPDPSKRVPGSIITVTAWPSAATKGMHILNRALKEARLKARCVSGVPREQVRDELQTADIFVAPSCYEETFCLTVAEALACGCAVIGSAVAGIRYQVERARCGILFENRTSVQLAQALTELANDPVRCREMGTTARAYMETHGTLERMGRDYEAFYGELV